MIRGKLSKKLDYVKNNSYLFDFFFKNSCCNFLGKPNGGGEGVGLCGTMWDYLGRLGFSRVGGEGIFAILQCSVFETNSFGFLGTKLRRSD